MAKPAKILTVLPHPWNPAQATERLRAMARNEVFLLSYKEHAKDQLSERGLIMGDALYLLRNGFVYENPKPATRRGFYKYNMESRTPNSGQRDIRITVIPDHNQCEAKIITVMWADEPIVSG